MLRERFAAIRAALTVGCIEVYGDRLVSLAVFGSVARGTMRPDSNIDVLLVVDALPNGRLRRVAEIEERCAAAAQALRIVDETHACTSSQAPGECCPLPSNRVTRSAPARCFWPPGYRRRVPSATMLCSPPSDVEPGYDRTRANLRS